MESNEYTLGEIMWKLYMGSTDRYSDAMIEYQQNGGILKNDIYVEPVERYNVSDNMESPIVSSLNVLSESIKSMFTSETTEDKNDSTTIRRTISTFASQKGYQKVAFVFPDDTIHLYDLENQKWYDIVISHQLMTLITVIEFNPVYKNVLAVGCQNGVFLITFHSYASSGIYIRPLSPSKKCISLSFSNDGLTLACSYSQSSSIYLYDTYQYISTSVPISSSSIFSSLSIPSPLSLSFSSLPGILLASCHNKLYIYNTISGEHCEYSLQQPLQSYCWSPDGQYLYFTTKHSTTVYIYCVCSSETSLDGNLAEYLLDTSVDNPESESIYEISIDPRGERLTCVYYNENNHGNKVAAVYRINERCHFKFLGNMILSSNDTEIIHSQYLECSDRESCLCTLLTDGHVHFMKGGAWKNSEDEVLKAAVMKYGKTNWARVASLLPRKTAKHCKARWEEWLDPRISKAEWTRDEDEKLMHLSKVLSGQWRTISTMMNRTAHQCLERYEKLLDDVSKEEGFNLDEENDPRRLRAGEIDPNPESRPARPDPKDMDDDEKEMLQEARARLANTKGKKAKRKARERQMEVARRLAAIQKRREMKTAGIDIRRKRIRRNKEIDYNAEIPFQHSVPVGFYDINEDIGEGGLDFKDRKRTIEEIEGVRRDKKEKELREKDAKNFHKLVEKDMPKAIAQINKINEASNIYVSETDLNTIIKQGYGTEEGITSGLLSSLPTPLATPAITPAITPMRTPLSRDLVREEARNQLLLQAAPTPLDIHNRKEEDQNYHYEEQTLAVGTGSAGITPSLDRGVTPNMIKSGLTPMGTPMPVGSTPLSSPFIHGNSIDNKVQNDRESLRSQLESLPAGQYEYGVALPDNIDTEEEEKKQVKVDRSLLERDIAREEEELYEYEYNHRSESLKRDLPVTLPSSSFTQTTSEDAVEGLLRDEMYSLLKYDVYKWVTPEKARKMPSKPLFTDEEIYEAKTMIIEEQQDLEPYALSDTEYISLHDLYKKDHIYNPITHTYDNYASLSKKDQVECMKNIYNNYVTQLNSITSKAKKLENKVSTYITGYVSRKNKLSENIEKEINDYDINVIEQSVFSKLYLQESQNIEIRVNTLEALVKEQKERNKQLQNNYKYLMNNLH
ncbi:hypothetical protein WA158_004638 [Blastocystis sp. Blastoise]